ncbi:hypothetical protein J2T60_001827 [Natronospira proteinivora]|uniref:Outer membrane protein beta-barrel domain-containing protein n=1 Tax=Natronospira proteinivora TaxID=1807133 RepID=A0ABT1G9V7_9GAMM|nr:outer membrane beta-barrel protein [Natronospira proteinivora]MCP1727827.1 hypothetical protein [Natronospira proteinivora]
MNKQIIAGLALAGSLTVAPTAQALPLIDFGVGAGALTLEDDDDAAIAVNLRVDINIPATPFSVEGNYTQTLTDGEFDDLMGSMDYSGNMLSAFFVGESPTPAVKIRGKIGVAQSDFDFSPSAGGSFSQSSTNFAYGVGVSVSNWHFEWTRTKLDDDFEADLDYLSATLTF